jgi:serine/threonine protein kinase
MNRSPQKLGRYQILNEVGRGAMGVVYKAHDPVIERDVAIKAIQLAFEATRQEKEVYLNRFYREAKAAGKLNHPNIVTIYDVDVDKPSDTPFIVMEYLEGTNLQEILSDGILLPLEDVNQVMIQVAGGLAYAHKRGVIHRDIKSANILIVEQLKAKITDFGIARIATSDLTKTGQYLGTPNYMSPEQVEGRAPVDGRSDLFSLGVIFYLLLTGERPFSGDSFTAISYKIVHVDPIPPRIINPAVPDACNKILGRLLAKDPAQRYQTGTDLIADLQKIGSAGADLIDLSVKEIEDVASQPSKKAEPELQQSQVSVSPLNKVIGILKSLPSSTHNISRFSLVATFLILLAGFAASAIYLFKPARQHAAPPVTNPSTPVQTVEKVRPVTSKPVSFHGEWDLAINYYRNGFYDKSTEQFQKILALDPQNESAQKYLELIERKKTLSQLRVQKAKSVDLKDSRKLPKQEAPIDVKKIPKGKISNAGGYPPAKISTIPKTESPVASGSPKPQPAVAKAGRINFEFEHSFPSGTFYIYSNDKLLYEGALSAKKKRVLMFRDYTGTLSGSLSVPGGEVELRLQAVSREYGISVEKRLQARIKEGQSMNLRIKFIKISKQLEIRWI